MGLASPESGPQPDREASASTGGLSDACIARPTPEQLAWADAEVGVLIHYDIEVFRPDYDFRPGTLEPPPEAFAPQSLDTDQWVAAAAAAGARYAVLVAKHCTGFCLWPSAAYDYSVRRSPWKGGRGDVVADFVASCERYGLRPGLYYSASVNAHLGVANPGRVRSGDPEEQRRYNAVVVTQLTELWSNYGPLFEIWFDGGVLSPEQGGPDIAPLLWRLQPGAVVFQGPAGTRSLLRWVGNEEGVAPDPCWSTVIGAPPARGGGVAGGRVWAPAESDMPGRDGRRSYQGGWFWRAGEDTAVFPAEHLLERYYQSVGRNSNLLLGMVVDDRGLVPDADVRALEGFGALVRRRFPPGAPATAGRGAEVEFALHGPLAVDHIDLMENIAHGERVRRWVVEGRTPDGAWRELCAGSSVGHRRIERLACALTMDSVRWRCLESVGEPVLRRLAAFGG